MITVSDKRVSLEMRDDDCGECDFCGEVPANIVFVIFGAFTTVRVCAECAESFAEQIKEAL